jgi:hypothetical protein
MKYAYLLLTLVCFATQGVTFNDVKNYISDATKRAKKRIKDTTKYELELEKEKIEFHHDCDVVKAFIALLLSHCLVEILLCLLKQARLYVFFETLFDAGFLYYLLQHAKYPLHIKNPITKNITIVQTSLNHSAVITKKGDTFHFCVHDRTHQENPPATAPLR